MHNLLTVFLFSIFSFVFLFITAKILGKKQITELDFTDYAVGISMGSIAAQWATDYGEPWYNYAIAISVYTLLSLGVTFLSRKTPFLKKLLQGSPIILINDGKIDYKQLKRSKLCVNDLLGLCRNQGFFEIENISYAILETNGNLSLLPKTETYKNEQVALPVELIIDGKIFYDQLEKLKKDEEWLRRSLPDKSRDIDTILLAIFKPSESKMIVYYKDQKTEEALLK